ncbi:hypothetical protein [Sorangium sp. So ce1097]
MSLLLSMSLTARAPSSRSIVPVYQPVIAMVPAASIATPRAAA